MQVFSVSTLLAGRQEGHPACKNWLYADDGDFNWHDIRVLTAITTGIFIISCCSKTQDCFTFWYRIIRVVFKTGS